MFSEDDRLFFEQLNKKLDEKMAEYRRRRSVEPPVQVRPEYKLEDEVNYG